MIDMLLSGTLMHPAYLAGLTDGEGCIRIHRQSSGRNFGLLVAIKMNDRQTIEAVAIAYGGKVTVDAHFKNQRPLYCWALYGADAVQILEQILPYLIYKKPQAELALEFYTYQTSLPRGSRTFRRTDEQVEKLNSYYLSLKEMKQV